MNIYYNYNLPSNLYSKPYLNYKKSKSKFQSSDLNSSICLKENIQCDRYIKNVAFTSSLTDIHLVNAVESIFNRSIVFGPEEYKILSSAELNVLREYGKHFTEANSKIVNFILDFGKLFSERIHKKYPNGFIFVSVGRSSAFLAKYLEFQGEKVKYCPISNIRHHIEFSPYFVQQYKKYLDSIGLTNEFVQKTQKPIIITDYTHLGGTLDNFSNLLAMPQIGINKGGSVIFSPITKGNSRYSRGNNIFDCWPHKINNYFEDKYGFSDALYIDMMGNDKTKKFTSIPHLDPVSYNPYGEKIFNKYYQNNNRFEEDFNTKMMNFLIADNVQG
ncbi:hypothetical protein J6P92_09535 [bacterium]|nr:hypothetical protein [bacterium]